MLETTNELDRNETFPPIDKSETELCKALWISAALQAVIDAKSNCPKKTSQHDKRNALIWLKAREEYNSDFATVCNLAGLDFQKTRAKLLEIVYNENESTDFRCIKKAMLENRGLELRSKYLKRIRRQESIRLTRQQKAA